MELFAFVSATSTGLTSIWPSRSLAAPSSPCVSSANHVQLARTVGLARRARPLLYKGHDDQEIGPRQRRRRRPCSRYRFFTALGMTLEAEMPVEGPWVDRVNGLESVQVDIVMMRTPDGHGRLELTKFRNPKLVEIEPAIAPPNALGLRSVMFTVESVDDSVARLRANGAELVGEVAQLRGHVQTLLHARPSGHH